MTELMTRKRALEIVHKIFHEWEAVGYLIHKTPIAAIADALLAAQEATLEAAKKACAVKRDEFLSPQYAAGQPESSFAERFACGACIEAIDALKEKPDA